MYAVLVLATLTIATANAGLIGAPLATPLATSIVGARTISLAGPAIAPIGLATPVIGKSIIGGPAIAGPLGLGLGAPWLGRSIVAAPAISSVAVGHLGAPVLRAW